MASASTQQPNAHSTSSILALVFVAFCLLFLALTPSLAQAGGGGGVYDKTYDRSQYKYGVDWDEDNPNAGTGSNVTTGVTGLDLDGGDFACTADGGTSGTLFVNPQCAPTRGGLFGVFANVVCRVENVFGTMMGLVYCSVSEAIVEPLLALLTLYVTVYGAMVILGMIPHTFAEAITRILKIGAVCAIALNAEIAIGVGYKFFITLTQTSIQIVFDVFTPDFIATDSALADMIQAGYQNSPNNPDASRRLYLGENWMQNLDYTTHRIIGFFMDGGLGFVIVMILLFIFAPPIFFILVYLIISLLKALATAVIGYLMALLGITFLFTVSPIFVSFALFRVTSGWFEAWLRNLLSYTLQIMVVFVFLMFTIMIDIVTFFQQVGGMIRHYEYVAFIGRLFSPFNLFTLCRPIRDGGDMMTGNILYYKFTVDGAQGNELGNRYEGFPRCIPKYDLTKMIDGTSGYRSPGSDWPSGLDGPQKDQLIEAIEAVRNGDYEITGDPDDIPSGMETINQIVMEANSKLYLPFMEMVTTTDLLMFLLVRFLVVICLTYLLNRFMGKIPHMASQLAGTGFAGRLGGGEQEPGDAAGLQSGKNFAGVDTGFAKFKQTVKGDGYYSKGFIFNAPSRFARGVTAGLGASGRSMMRDSLSRAGSLGLSGDVRRELVEDQSILESKREGLFAPSRGGIGRHDGAYHPGGRTGRERPSAFGSPRRSRYGN